MITNAQLKKLILGFVLVGIAFLFYYYQDQGAVSNNDMTIEGAGTIQEIQDEITVDISGAVKNPSVFTLSNGSRVFNAINIAGGLTENANISVINIVGVLADEEHIFIPSQDNPGYITGEIQVIDISVEEDDAIFVSLLGEVVNPCVIKANETTCRVVDALNAAGGTTADTDISRVNLAEKLKDEMDIFIPRKGSEESNLININTASELELRQLSGIGEVIANEIIRYREKNGSFKKIEDIKNVPGIGTGKFEIICKEICVY